jgi:hypothetical protein
MATRSTHGSGSPESNKDHALNLDFEDGFLLRHRGDATNSFCSLWDCSGRRWQLVVVQLLPQAMGKVPTVVMDFGEAHGVVDLAPRGG